MVPELRFPEFWEAEEWEEKTLDTVFLSVANGLTLAQTNDGTGYKVTRIETISDKTIDLKKVGYVQTKQDISTHRLCVGDILFSNINSVSHIGKVAIIDRDYDLYHGMNLLRLVPDAKSNVPLFLYYQLNTRRLKSSFEERANKAINQASINQTELKKTILAAPLLGEQQKIADCLTSIDDLITAHTQKLDALKAHKKGLMQQLFPAEGETVPKLRFPEFRGKGAWVGKRLSGIAKLTSSKRVHLADYVPNGVPFFRGKEITLLRERKMPEDILYISEEHYEEIQKKYGVPEAGDILITAVGTLGNVYRIRNSDKFYFKDGNLIWLKDISENTEFLEVLLLVRRNDVLGSAIGSSQKALTMVELNKLKFCFPGNKEQQKIADCLTSIDDLITAQAQKIDVLKSHKKGLMQQLFPGHGCE